MGTFTKPITVALGVVNSGLAGTLGYTVKDVSGTALVARTTAGVSEVLPTGVAASGMYRASVAGWDEMWAGFVEWDDGASLAVCVPFEPKLMKLDLTQAIPTSNMAQTVGDALNAARAQAFGKWVLSGTSLTLYAADGTTVVRTFTLDNSVSPTQRV